MERQLVLVDTNSKNWKLDERTREVGRRGIAAAREMLRHAGPQRAA
jgi:hypothetical protein